VQKGQQHCSCSRSSDGRSNLVTMHVRNEPYAQHVGKRRKPSFISWGSVYYASMMTRYRIMGAYTSLQLEKLPSNLVLFAKASLRDSHWVELITASALNSQSLGCSSQRQGSTFQESGFTHFKDRKIGKTT